MDDFIIDPGEWRTLTRHQKHRVVILKPEATMAHAKAIIQDYGTPFKTGKTRITAEVLFNDGFKLSIHALWFEGK